VPFICSIFQAGNPTSPFDQTELDFLAQTNNTLAHPVNNLATASLPNASSIELQCVVNTSTNVVFVHNYQFTAELVAGIN
jgi:hypothetical protein